MTAEEIALAEQVIASRTAGDGLPKYQRLVNMMADRIHREFGGEGAHEFEPAEEALVEADTASPEPGLKYFQFYEEILRSKHAAKAGRPS